MPRSVKKINGENRSNACLLIETKKTSDSLQNVFQISKVKSGVSTTTNDYDNLVDKITDLLNEVCVSIVNALLHVSHVLSHVRNIVRELAQKFSLVTIIVRFSIDGAKSASLA